MLLSARTLVSFTNKPLTDGWKTKGEADENHSTCHLHLCGDYILQRSWGVAYHNALKGKLMSNDDYSNGDDPHWANRKRREPFPQERIETKIEISISRWWLIPLFMVALVIGVLIVKSAKANEWGTMELGVRVTASRTACWSLKDAQEIVDAASISIDSASHIFTSYVDTTPSRCGIGKVSYTPHEVVGSGIDIDGDLWLIVRSTAHSLPLIKVIFIMTTQEVILKAKPSSAHQVVIRTGVPFRGSWWFCKSKPTVDSVLSTFVEDGFLEARKLIMAARKIGECSNLVGTLIVDHVFQKAVVISHQTGLPIHVQVVQFRVAGTTVPLYAFTNLKIIVTGDKDA